MNIRSTKTPRKAKPAKWNETSFRSTPSSTRSSSRRERAEAEVHLAGCAALRALAAASAGSAPPCGPRCARPWAPAPGRARPRGAARRVYAAPWPGSAARSGAALLSPLPLATAGRLRRRRAGGARHRTPATAGLVEEAVRKHHRGLPLEVTTASVAPRPSRAGSPASSTSSPSAPHFAGAAGPGGGGAPLQPARVAGRLHQVRAPARPQAGLFIVDDPDRRFDAGGRDVRDRPAPRCGSSNSRGYNIVVWRQDQIVYSLVSDLGRGRPLPDGPGLGRPAAVAPALARAV